MRTVLVIIAAIIGGALAFLISASLWLGGPVRNTRAFRICPDCLSRVEVRSRYVGVPGLRKLVGTKEVAWPSLAYTEVLKPIHARHTWVPYAPLVELRRPAVREYEASSSFREYVASRIWEHKDDPSSVLKDLMASEAAPGPTLLREFCATHECETTLSD